MNKTYWNIPSIYVIVFELASITYILWTLRGCSQAFSSLENALNEPTSLFFYLSLLFGFYFKLVVLYGGGDDGAPSRWFMRLFVGEIPQDFQFFFQISWWLCYTPSKYYYLYLMDNLNILLHGLFIFNAYKRRFFRAYGAMCKHGFYIVHLFQWCWCPSGRKWLMGLPQHIILFACIIIPPLQTFIIHNIYNMHAQIILSLCDKGDKFNCKLKII